MKWYLAFSSTVILLISYVCYRIYYITPEPNACDMTVMYRNMYFMKIKVTIPNITDTERKNNPALNYAFTTDFSYYSTILYGEGQYAVQFSRSGTVSGIPVLFVPGNAGSARQVRSLGSVMQNKTESRYTSFHFNVFAVDFNEELSGIGGMYLERQTRYLKYVVNHIWGMYDPSPTGIIIVAHSMGGIVVRSLLNDADFESRKISLVITLGTPHRSPPVIFDSFMENVYTKMHRAWKRKKHGTVPLISIFGGLKDTLIPEHLSTEPGILHFSTAGIDGVEAEADHLCIVWCNQLVRHISRVLFEYAEAPEQFSKNFNALVNRFYKSNGNVYRKPEKLENSFESIIIKQNNLTVVKNRKNCSTQAAIKVDGAIKNTGIFVMFSRGLSWLLDNGQMYYANGYRHFQYAFIPTVAAQNRFTAVLAPNHTFKAVAINSEAVKKETVTVNLIALTSAFTSPIWSSIIDGRRLAVIIPVKITYVWFAIKAQLKEIECENKSNRGHSKIEFTSKGVRRLSNHINGVETVVGYKLYANATDSSENNARFMFILNTKCQYQASITFDLTRTAILVFQRYAYLIGFYVVLYLLSSLFAVFCCNDMGISNGTALRPYNFCCRYIFGSFIYLALLTSINRSDGLLNFISMVILTLFFGFFSELCSLITMFQLKLVNTRVFYYITHDYLTVPLLLMMLCVSYSNNGFIPITILLLVSLTNYLKAIGRDFQLHDCSAAIQISALHLISFILFLPFGICSVWNLHHYRSMETYHDPTRLAAYISITIMLIFRVLPKLYINCKLEYAIFLAVFTIIIMDTESMLCLSRLGTYLAVVLVTLTNLYDESVYCKR